MKIILLIFGTLLATSSGGPTRHFLRDLAAESVFCVCGGNTTCSAEDTDSQADPCGAGCPCCGDETPEEDLCCDCLDECTTDNIDQVQNPCSAGCPCAPEYIFCACEEGNCNNATDPTVAADPCGAGCLCCDDEDLPEGDSCCNCLDFCTANNVTVEEACSAGCPCSKVEKVYCECGEATCSDPDSDARVADPCGAGCPCCGDETLQGDVCCNCLDECTSDNIDQVQNPCSAGCPCAE